MAAILKGGQTYTVHDLIGENERFRFYRASSEGRPDKELMLKIGIAPEQNGVLDREAFLLTSLADEAARLEAEYARRQKGAGALHYQIGFPTLVETFIAQDQGARRVLVFAFEAADSLAELAPLSLIRKRDRVRVDPRTSAWVLGKSLKILAFAHDQGIKVGNLTGDNILIVREHHLVTLLDWSAATLRKGPLRSGDACEDIRALAREVVQLLGGNLETGSLPESEQLLDGRYAEFLTGLLRGAHSNAFEAHSAFYHLVEALWKRSFHPYTTFPLEEKE